MTATITGGGREGFNPLPSMASLAHGGISGGSGTGETKYNSRHHDELSAKQYYSRILPGQTINSNGNGIGIGNGGSSHDVMLQKINYMINLLEEQRDEKTNNVTEEVILYSFLGIFIIFIVDSFSKVGKYVR